MNNTLKKKSRNPFFWVPSIYFTEGVPYVMVTILSAIMYKRLGLSNTEIALYTSWLYLPWVIKPLWSPFVDLIKSKRWWIISMQLLIGASLGGIALSLNLPNHIQITLAIFWLLAFSSATHDIAADGYYLLELDTKQQAWFVGIRSLFYRFALILGQGFLIMAAGTLETITGRIQFAWSLTFFFIAGVFIALSLYHNFILPKPSEDKPVNIQPSEILKDFVKSFVTFFQKPHAVSAILFMLLFRLPEALLTKISPLFLLDDRAVGGLGLTTAEEGFAVGTIGVLGLIIGGILGGIAVAKDGFKKWFWPMVWSISLPDIIYILFSYYRPENLLYVNIGLFIEQFGYGFGFTAYMVFLMYYARGNNKTTHYAICTGFMALSMMLPGMMAGWLQESVGYLLFFTIATLCCAVTILTSFYVKIPNNIKE